MNKTDFIVSCWFNDNDDDDVDVIVFDASPTIITVAFSRIFMNADYRVKLHPSNVHL